MRVSVIATVLNEGPSIRVLLDSVLNQTRAPDEVIIVDGGSTDDTVQIIESYRAVILGYKPIPVLGLSMSIIVISLFFISGIYFFRRIEKNFADVV